MRIDKGDRIFDVLRFYTREENALFLVVPCNDTLATIKINNVEHLDHVDKPALDRRKQALPV